METYNLFNEKIGEFLKKHLANHELEYRGKKIIHDPLWGSNLFYPWEVALIDTPLFQRLRRIHQTGTAFFTYPSSCHNRFTHSIGVAILADRLIKKLRDDSILAKDSKIEITNKDIYEVRLAGLLHDMGHCFFSHTSEQVFKNLIDFHKIKSEFQLFKKKKVCPHEIFAFLMITHPIFIEFMSRIEKLMFKNGVDFPDIHNIAKIIIGADLEPKKRFLKEIITGPYDVDKLEYLYRDGYHAGLKIAYDIDRYFYRITIGDTSSYSGVKDEMRLIMDLSGVTAAEQLIFSKMMLFSYIYHHQKVRSADCLVRDIVFNLLQDKKLPISIEHPCDFLNYTDYDLLSCFAITGDDEFNKLVLALQNRVLLKRCFVICKDYVIGISADQEIAENYEQFCISIRDIFIEQKRIRSMILERINKISEKTYTINDIYIDLPEVPSIEEAAKAPVKLPNGNIEPMSKYYQLEGWQKVYEVKKLRGYFYVKSELVEEANKIIREIIAEEYHLKFSELSSLLAKVGSS
jgi:HD superfamily phosphohydrolase